MENELLYGGVVVVRYMIAYPQFTSPTYFPFLDHMNQYYQAKAQRLADYCQTRFFSDAVANYEEAKANQFPFHAHDLQQNFVITMNMNCIVSLYLDTGTYTGGANGTTSRTSDNWDVINEWVFSLGELFPTDRFYESYVKELIIVEIEHQMKNGTSIYFADYKALVNEYFDPRNFYMTPLNLVVFFDEMTIAPHSSGIVTFELPFVEGPIRPKNC